MIFTEYRDTLQALAAVLPDAMLAWPAGPRDSDGVWAPHWYSTVWASTGFEAWRPRETRLEGEAAQVAAACRPAYDKLHAHRLRVA